MIRPALPHNETERLELLDSYNILDTLPEKDYDDITALASQICGMPIALVSLVDEKRQWFKSHHGLDATETPRELAFCAHAINNVDDVLVVNNALEDERFHDNPLVTGAPNVIFYAGAPLVDEGMGVGTLCVIDNKPNELTQEQQNTLKILASHVVTYLKLKKSESNLQRQNAALTKLQAGLLQKNKELQQFVYVASHDLQEPLRNLGGMVEIISENLEDSDNEEVQQCLHFMNKSNQRMKSLIVNLLEHSRIGNETTEEDVDLNAVFADVKADLATLIQDKNAKVTSEELPTVLGNAPSLRQLFQNLISNSIKYKHEDRDPEINISVTELEDKYQFKFSDNGMGIEEKNFERIFVIFQRLRRSNQQSGVGIGLANCKKIVDSMGGEIWVESDGSSGSDFYFTLLKH